MIQSLFQRRYGIACVMISAMLLLSAFQGCVVAAAGPLFNEPIVGTATQGNIYRCFRDGMGYPVCQKIGDTGVAAPAAPAELEAAKLTALYLVPMRPRRNPFDGGGATEACGNAHGASGCCRITAVLPDGDVIVECGTR